MGAYLLCLLPVITTRHHDNCFHLSDTLLPMSYMYGPSFI